MLQPIEVHVRVTGGPKDPPPRTLVVEAGTTLRQVLHELGLPVEGTALWWDGAPVPSDAPVLRPGELEVVRTFSGG